MSPIVFLVVFCVVMTAIASWRAVGSDRVAAGTAIVVGGVTTVALAWALREQAWTGLPGQLLVATAGATLVFVGGVLMLCHWDGSPTTDV